MSGFATRWVVAREFAVAPGDFGPDDGLLDSVIEGWILAACDEYLEHCAALRAVREAGGLTTGVRIGARNGMERLRGATDVLVSVRATEFLPDVFRLAVRVRGPDGVVDTTCEVRLEDAAGTPVALDESIRDELIALEHAASHIV